MAEYNFFKQEHNEKGRVRELEGMLASERAKNDTERKTLIEKNILLEEFKSRLVEYENREKHIISQYEDKIRSFQNEMLYHDNLKKSQIMSTE